MSLALTTPSTSRSTRVTPTLSLAFIDTVTVPVIVDLAPGLDTETVGAVVSFDTVTVTALDVPTLPAASYARACNWLLPLLTLVVDQAKAYGELVSLAMT